MVRNFASILDPAPASEEEMLALALSAIEQYDLVGVYEELPRFIECLAAMLGLPPSLPPKQNTTRDKPERISPQLRQRIEELNQFDLKFYSQVQTLAAKYQPPKLVEQPRWQPWPGLGEKRLQKPCVQSFRAALEGETFKPGEMLRFSLEFSLAEKVGELEIGIHIFDEVGRWIFGTNTTLLGRPQREIGPGAYKILWYVVADLLPGRYSVGFALADRSQGLKELFWRDTLLSFRILLTDKIVPSVGLTDLPVGFVLQRN
jgi:hypothetical protein